MENTTQISYDRLWKLLIDRKLKKKGLQELTHLSPSVITKMGRNESVHFDILAKICYALRCNIEDLVEIKLKGE